MSFSWSTIGEKVSTLFEEMEYGPATSIEQRIEEFVAKCCKLPRKLRIINHEQNKFNWIFRFRNLLTNLQSDLIKLFPMTNYRNGVAVLIEYCDYYELYYDVTDNETHNFTSQNIPVGCLDNPVHMLYFIFTILADTEGMNNKQLNFIWEQLVTCTGGLPVEYGAAVPKSGPYGCFTGPLAMISAVNAMVVMADSDVYAAVQALGRTCRSVFKVSRVLVQEPIKEKFLNTIQNATYRAEISNCLYVFRNTGEALGNLNVLMKFKAVSVWSDNITAAKKFARDITQICTIWINAHGQLGAGLNSMFHIPPVPNKQDYISTDLKTCGEVKHSVFCGGKWHAEIELRTDMNLTLVLNGDYYDLARKAHQLWRAVKLNERAKIIRSFAERLQSNGESEYADLVLRLVNLPLTFGTSIAIANDGEAEVLTTSEPVGVVVIASSDKKMLFAKLIIASVTGNAVIVVSTIEGPAAFSSYCDLLGSCGFPPGVINCLSLSSLYNIRLKEQLVNRVLAEHSDILSPEVSEMYKGTAAVNTLYKKFFTSVTKPKSVWIPCA